MVFPTRELHSCWYHIELRLALLTSPGLTHLLTHRHLVRQTQPTLAANARDLAGCTPLHYAGVCGHTDVVHALLGACGDPSRRTRDGATPLDLARAEGHTSVVRLLTRTFTRVADVEFSYGVALEGALSARAGGGGDSSGASGSGGGGGGLGGLFAGSWRPKYAVVSRAHCALFLWSGTPTSLEGALTRLKLRAIASVAVTGGKGSARFTIRPITGAGDPLELKAASPEDAAIWCATIKAAIVTAQVRSVRVALSSSHTPHQLQ